MLAKILTANLSLKDALLDSKNKKIQGNNNGDVIQRWILLQDAINTFVDSSMASKVADKELTGLR